MSASDRQFANFPFEFALDLSLQENVPTERVI
jgi:hypothetical protein